MRIQRKDIPPQGSGDTVDLSAHEQDIPPTPLNLARSMGLVLQNSRQERWLSETDRQEAVSRCCRLHVQALEDTPELTVKLIGKELSINDQPVDTENSLVAFFVELMGAHEANNYTLYKGLTQPEFGELIEVFLTPPEKIAILGGFVQAVRQIGLQHIRSRNIVYKQVADDQLVVDRGVLDLAGSVVLSGPRREAVVQYLQGGELPPAMVDDFQALANTETPHLAKLIIEASDGDSDDDTVPCLQRAYEALLRIPQFQTQKGKKTLTRLLHELGDAFTQQQLEKQGYAEGRAIHSAIEGMVDDLAIDSLAASYSRQRKSADNNEKRIVRFMKRKGLSGIQESGLQERLAAGGLDETQWIELLAKSGADLESAEADSAGPPAVRKLQDLLEEAEQHPDRVKLSTDKPDPRLEQVLNDVGREMTRLAAQTQRRVMELAREVDLQTQEERSAGSTKKRRTRRVRPAAMLAEIVQEFCQPLSVISCSLSMVVARHLGDVPQSQHDMLQLALENARRMEALTTKLRDISGLPASLSPDTELRDNVYGAAET